MALPGLHARTILRAVRPSAGLCAAVRRSELTRGHSCTAAPGDADAGSYRLADAAGQLTEKRLRSLLSRCPEWNDESERLCLATSLEAEEAQCGMSSGAVNVLRSHSCANMRKRAMLCLANRWRYRSDCWSERRGGSGVPVAACDVKRPRKRPASDDGRAACAKQLALEPVALPSQPQQTTLPLEDRTFVMHHAANSYVLGMMSTHITAAARAWTGPLSAVHYGRARGEGMTWLRVRSIEGALEVAHWLRAVCKLRLGGMRDWRDALSAEELRMPAYASNAAHNSPWSELEALRYATTQGHASTHGVADALRAAMGTLRAQDAAWVQDFDHGYNPVMTMIAAAHAFIAAQRMEPLRGYLEVAEAVLGGIQRYAEECVTSLQQRVDWISEAAASQGPAAGLRCEAKARVPPLVERLRLTDDCEQGVALLALARTPPPKGAPLPRFTLTTHA